MTAATATPKPQSATAGRRAAVAAPDPQAAKGQHREKHHEFRVQPRQGRQHDAEQRDTPPRFERLPQPQRRPGHDQRTGQLRINQPGMWEKRDRKTDADPCNQRRVRRRHTAGKPEDRHRGKRGKERDEEHGAGCPANRIGGSTSAGSPARESNKSRRVCRAAGAAQRPGKESSVIVAL
jgi:hypothetical protein